MKNIIIAAILGMGFMLSLQYAVGHMQMNCIDAKGFDQCHIQTSALNAVMFPIESLTGER